MARFSDTSRPCGFSHSRRGSSQFLIEALELRILLSQTYAWSNAPIEGGGFVDGIEFSPAQQNLIYARTDVGGSYRWDSATNSWIPLNDSLGRADSQLTGVLSLAPDPSNANNVYEAVGQYTESFGENAAILYSTDQGATWGRTNLPFKLGGNEDGRGAGERLQVDPNDGSILFLGTNNNGLWKSTDSGHTWAQVTTFPAAASSLTFVLFDKRSATAGNATQTIYVGVNAITGTNLYRSTDGGVTWAAVPGEPTGKLAFQAAIDSAGSLYVTYDNNLGPNNVTAGAVDRLNTTTGVWTVITPPTGQGGFAGVSIDPSVAGTVIVTTTDRWSPHDQIYRSTDSGAHWTSLWASNTTFDYSSAPWVNLTPSWLDAVAIDPFNSNHALFGTGFGLYSSTTIQSGAVTWSFTDSGLEETVPLGLIAPSSGAPLGVAVGDIDGFQFTSTTSVPTSRFTPNFGTDTSIDFAEDVPSKWVRTFTGSTDGAYSTDDGVTWTTFASAPSTISNGPGNIAISADGSTLVWIPTDSAAYYSTNNGASWQLSAGSPSNASNSFTPIADRANPSIFYLYDYTAGIVYVSINGGVSFSASVTGLPTGGSTPHAVPGIAGDLWLPTGSGLYHSTNAGATFSKLSSVQAAYQIGFGKAATGHTYPAIYLWGEIGGVIGLYRSDDTGATWTRINDNNHQFGWINQIVGDPNVYGRVYLATGGRGVVVGNVVNAAPTVATAASASPNPVTGTTSALSVLGADDDGEANLIYTWAVTSDPPGPVTFSANGTNAAKNSVATFSDAGTYAMLVTITDASGASTTSGVNIVVSQTATSLTVTPNSASLYPGGSEQLSAAAFDQFGNPLIGPPPFNWTVIAGGGDISTSGLYTAPAQPTVATLQVTLGPVVQFAAIATALPLLGDANLDGVVDLNDLNVVLNHLGSVTSAWTEGNFDGAATIDLNDLNDVLNHLGETTVLPPAPNAAAAPLVIVGPLGMSGAAASVVHTAPRPVLSLGIVKGGKLPAKESKAALFSTSSAHGGHGFSYGY